MVLVLQLIGFLTELIPGFKILVLSEVNMSYWQKNIQCEDIDYGTYQCAYHIYVPWLCKLPYEHDSQKKPKVVSIDKCLLPEVLRLWEMGIKTTGCCCGHGRSKPFISVAFEDIQKMKELGYKVQYNSCRPYDEDSFVPKTELRYGIAQCTEY